MRRTLAVGALLLSVALALQGGPAVAQACDNRDGQDITVAGTIDNVTIAGVIFFRDRKTGCQIALVANRNDKGCKAGGQIEASGKLMKSPYLPGTYEVDRGSKPPNETLVCR